VKRGRGRGTGGEGEDKGRGREEEGKVSGVEGKEWGSQTPKIFWPRTGPDLFQTPAAAAPTSDDAVTNGDVQRVGGT